MVKNITIKDEAFEYLKSKKGTRSYSDVILAKKKREVKEAGAAYGETMIPVSQETKEYLDELRGSTKSYDDIIRKSLKKPSKSYLALKKFAGTMRDEEWDFDPIKIREEVNRSFERRLQELDRN